MHEWGFDVACGLKESQKDSELIHSNLDILNFYFFKFMQWPLDPNNGQ